MPTNSLAFATAIAAMDAADTSLNSAIDAVIAALIPIIETASDQRLPLRKPITYRSPGGFEIALEAFGIDSSGCYACLIDDDGDKVDLFEEDNDLVIRALRSLHIYPRWVGGTPEQGV